MRLKTVPIFFAFFLMGIADAMGPMSNAVKNDYQISNVAATLLSFFVFIAFAVFSVPGGLLAVRIGKKNLLLLGLGLNAVAVLIPSVSPPSFELLLGCIFLLGVGITLLQVAGNPIMRDVSEVGGYSRNLSFAQGIKGLGSTASTYLVTAVTAIAVFQGMGWRGAFPVFFVLMALTFVMVLFLKVDETKADVPPSIASSVGLLKEPIFFLAVLGIFLYVGAEASMGRFLLPTLQAIGVDDATATKFGPAMFFLLLTIGRLAGGAILLVISPRVSFRLSALLGLLGAAAIMFGIPAVAIGGVIAAGLGFANIWPLLFSITVEERPERASELSGLMCMAISGGAIVPLVMGQLVDMDFGATAFVVPAACFAYLLALSLQRGGAAKA
jgi:MFS transporter, FHS family, L-fucose permease